MSYVTGSHAFKTGITRCRHRQLTAVRAELHFVYVSEPDSGLADRVGVPNEGSGSAWQTWVCTRRISDHQTADAHVGRGTTFLGTCAGGSLPERLYAPAISWGEVKRHPRFDDISPRLGAGMTCLANGKTAFKGRWGGMSKAWGIVILRVVHPALALVESTTGPGRIAMANYIPELQFAEAPAANGECGPMANNRFGSATRPSTDVSRRCKQGWGPGYNWQVTGTLQYELRPGLGAYVSYFRCGTQNHRDDKSCGDAADYDRTV